MLRSSFLRGRIAALGTGGLVAAIAGCSGADVASESLGQASEKLSGTLPAPVKVFGQPDIKQTNYNEVVSYRAFHPAGVLIDRLTSPAASHAYVFDSGNNRILGFDTLGTCSGSGTACTESSACGTGNTCQINPQKTAKFTLGQPSTSAAGACNGDNTTQAPATRGSLCLIPYPEQPSPLEGPRGGQMARDAAHNLYVVDTFNNRVLRYDNPFATGADTLPDWVWGQTGYTTRNCNQGGAAGRQTLCTGQVSGGRYDHYFTSSVDVTSDGKIVWVADPGNHRVLKLVPGQADAALVLGQAGYTNPADGCVNTTNSDVMCVPTGIAYNESTKTLYVLDTETGAGGSGRILVYNNPSANGAAPNEIWTAPIEPRITGTIKFEQKNFKWARGLTLEPTTGALWVDDTDNNRALRYVNKAVTHVVGDCDLDPTNAACAGNFGVQSPHGSIGFDRDGKMYLPDLGSQRVLRYPGGTAVVAPPAAPNPAVEISGAMFDQPNKNDQRHANHVGPSGLANPGFVTFVGNQVAIADRGRILFWNDYRSGSLAGGNANGVLAQDDFNSQVSNDVNLGGDFTSLAHDASKKLLYASHGGWVTAWDTSLGLQTRAPSSFRFHGSQLSLKGGGLLPCDKGCFFVNLYVDAARDIGWIADSGYHRILRVLDVSKSTRSVDLVLGQDNVNGNICNRGAGTNEPPDIITVREDGFCDPTQVAFDKTGNLYVVDGTWECRTGNCRIVEFAASDLPAVSSSVKFPKPKPERVYGPQSKTSRDCDPSAGYLCSPRFVAFDPRDGSMVATGDAYSNPDFGKRLAVWQNPTQAGVTFPKPSGFLGQRMNQAGNVAFTSDGYMAVLDHTWDRAVVYATPACNPATETCAPTECTPMNGCTTAQPLAWNTNSGEFGTTGEKWFVIDQAPPTAWNAWDIDGRTIKVNGVAVTKGQLPLPAPINGKYYFQFSAGTKTWASWAFW